jgi:hypothetical protein
MNKPKDMQQRYLDDLAYYRQEPRPWGDTKLKIAICVTMLQDFAAAKDAFRVTLDDFLNSANKAWLGTNQPHWLTDTYMLADSPTLYEQTWRELHTFKLAPRPGLWGLYAYGSLCLVGGKDAEALKYATGLLTKPKYKDMFAAGQAIQAITARDQASLDQAFANLLVAHRGMAKIGGLRETPEGYLCLPAMALAKVALERGMTMNAESEYLAKGYLEYLQRDR